MSETVTETMDFAGEGRQAPAGPRDQGPVRPAPYEFAAISHPGKVRSNNEDHFLITRNSRTFSVVGTNMPPGALPDLIDEVAYGMVVADGMGGMAAGEKASQLAIRTGVGLFLNSSQWTTRIDEHDASLFIGRIRDYFRQVDSAVIGEAKADRHLTGMGTTLTFAYIVGHEVYVFHVGDSRAYLYRKGKLEQRTRDHTMAQTLADAGAIRPEDVHRHAKRHVLTNFVGGPSSGVEPEIVKIRLQPGDYLLLCSDGLTEMVPDDEIARILRDSGGPDPASRALIARALDAGGRDNVTVLLARYQGHPAG